jgi:hypothetical protein
LGSQSWLPPAFSRRLDALESASAGKIACPTRVIHIFLQKKSTAAW